MTSLSEGLNAILEEALSVANTEYAGMRLFGGQATRSDPFTVIRDDDGNITSLSSGARGTEENLQRPGKRRRCGGGDDAPRCAGQTGSGCPHRSCLLLTSPLKQYTPPVLWPSSERVTPRPCPESHRPAPYCASKASDNSTPRKRNLLLPLRGSTLLSRRASFRGIRRSPYHSGSLLQL